MHAPLLILLLSLSLSFSEQPVSDKDPHLTFQDSTAKFYYQKGEEWLYSNFDSAEYYFDLAIPLFQKEENWIPLIESYNYKGNIAYQKGLLSNFEENIYHSLDYCSRYLSKPSRTYCTVLNSMGVLYYNHSDYPKAIEYFSQALEYYRELNNTYEYQMGCLQNLSTIALLILDYDKALEYLQEAQRINKLLAAQTPLEEIEITNKIGDVLIAKKQYQEAEKVLSKTKKLLSQMATGGSFFRQQTSVNRNFAKIYLARGQAQKARSYLKENLSLYNKTSLKEHFWDWELLSKIELLDQNIEKAKIYSYKAIQLVKERFKSKATSRQISRVLRNHANILKENKELDEALCYYQEAIEYTTTNFKGTEVLANPAVEKIKNQESAYLAFTGKATILEQIYWERSGILMLEAALQSWKLAAEIMELLRQKIQISGSKQRLAKVAMPIYEGGLRTALHLYQLKGESNYLEDAFQFAEQNKFILLRESQNKLLATQQGNLPDSLQERELLLRATLTRWENAIKEGVESGISEDTLNNWNKELLKARKAYEVLTITLESNYPLYLKLKYKTEISSIACIQEKLDSKEVMLEYFFGDQQVYLFTITPQHVEIFPLEKCHPSDEKLTTLIQFLHEIKNDFSIENFYQLSYDIYSDYVKPGLQKLSSTYDRLIIIPDGNLAYLPFEILLKNPYPNSKRSLSPLAYLIKSSSINYSYSGTLWANGLESQIVKKDHTFLGVAPNFPDINATPIRDCHDRVLAKLNCNAQEVEGIQKITGGQLLLGNQATKEAFSKVASDYNIIHLATHACVHSQEPTLSKIYFSDQTLSNSEVSLLQLNAELIVLSACNTGIGKRIAGEGVMSLARNFRLAGGKSIVFSLWAVDDCTTANLMAKFYKALEQGKAKDQALRQAKLEYLQEADQLHQHPFYWAGFIHAGNSRALPMLASSNKKILAIRLSLLFVFLLLGSWCWWYKSRA